MTYRYDHPDNLVALLEESVQKFTKRPLFGTKNADGEYEWVTYGEIGRRVDHLRGGLARMRIGKGDAVGIIADNRTEWAVCASLHYRPHQGAVQAGKRQVRVPVGHRRGDQAAALGEKRHGIR